MTSIAQVEKEKGNASFKSADYAAAVGYYSAAIIADRKDPTLPLNRAAAYLKLGKFNDAERDCSTVLALQNGSKNVKAWFRRAQARIELGKHGDAKEDLEAALKLEPSNEPVKLELKKLQGLHANKTATSKGPKPSPKSPIIPTISAQKPYRRRIPISIVEDPKLTPEPQSQRDAPILQQSTAESSNLLLAPITSRPLVTELTAQPRSNPKQTQPKPTPSTKQPSQPNAKNVIWETREVKGKKVGGGIFRHPTRKSEKEIETEGSSPGASSATFDATPSNVIVSPGVPQSFGITGVAQSTPPISLFAFNKAWASFNSPSKRWDLVMQIHPIHLPKFFQTSLEAGLLVSILGTFLFILSSFRDNHPEVQDVIILYMREFSKVPRFQTLLLFLTDKEAGIVRELITSLGGIGVIGSPWKNIQ